MKKLLFLPLFLFIVFSSSLQADNARLVHEWTVDLYYANGVNADARNTERGNWARRTDSLKLKYPSLKQALRFGEAKLSYNASYLWGLSDLTEVIVQYRAEHPMAEVTWQGLRLFLLSTFKFDVGGLITMLGKMTSSATLAEQANAYEESVRSET